MNEAGADPLRTPQGDFLVYSEEHSANLLGDFRSSGNLYGRSFEADSPSDLEAEFAGALGSRMVYVIRPTVVVRADNKERTYGVDNPSFTYTLAGLIDEDDPSAAVSGAFVSAAKASDGVGVYTINESETDPFKSPLGYDVQVVGGTLLITPRPITVAAHSLTKGYGDADPALTYTITQGSLLDSDSLSGALVRAAGESVGPYAISQGTLGDSNYSITFEGGVFIITPRPITIAAYSHTKGYGDADPALTYTIASGSLVGSDTLEGALVRAHGEDVGDYVIS